MSLNKCIYDFHLVAEGWLSVPPHDEGREEASASTASDEATTPADRVASVRMIEFGSDDKSDIWYKAEILQVSPNHTEAKTLIEKYGLPHAILVNCSAQKEELCAQLLRGSSDL